MTHELTNLLPRDRQHRIGQSYYIRLATVAVFALAVLVLVGVALLAPSFLYVQDEVTARQARIDAMNASLSQPTGQNANATLTNLAASATYLSRLASTTTASAALRGVLAVPRAGITLTSISYTPPTTGNDGSMSLSGMASTRESLRAYSSALSALPFVTSSNLPISAYAKEADIPFSVTLTGSFAATP